jgi:hypothetical protein
LAITEANVGKLLDGITTVNALLLQIVAAKWIKHPAGFRDVNQKPINLLIEPDILQGMKLTAEQHKELDPRGVKICKRFEDYMPEWLKRNLDLYLFASMFISYTAGNMRTAMVAQVNRDVARARQQVRDQRAAQVQPGDSDKIPAAAAPGPTNGLDQNPPPPPSQEPPTQEL